MKHLTIHVGLPKTATTSLQHNLFLRLHDEGYFHYLGRADQESDFFLQNRNYAKEIREALFDKHSCVVDSLDHGQGRFLMSDESFTIPAFYNLYAFGYDYSIFDIPSRLKAVFSDQIQRFSILISIRNQADLLESLYAQRYDRFFRDPEHDRPDRHFFSEGQFKASLFADMDYSRLINAYRAEFGESNVYVNFYEDFLSENEDYFSTLATVCGAEIEYVKLCLRATPFNVREVEGGRKLRRVRTRSEPYVRLAAVAKRAGVGRVARWIPDSIKRASFRDEKLTVPSMNPKLKKKIREHYVQQNCCLVDMGLARSKLDQYGYI